MGREREEEKRMRVLTGHQDFKGRVRGESGGKQEYKYDRCRGSFGHGDLLLRLLLLLLSSSRLIVARGEKDSSLFSLFLSFHALCLYTCG